jgi:hypothetical protein
LIINVERGDFLTELKDVAKVIRSKNAGPYSISVDVMFSENKEHKKFIESQVLSEEWLAAVYNVEKEDVSIFPHEPSMSVKVVIRRKVVAGSIKDKDIYGAQQHVPFLDLKY